MDIKPSVRRLVKSIFVRLQNVGWDDLRSVGNSRLISTAFLWVVLVPWVARVLAWLNVVWPSGGDLTLPRNMWLAWSMSWLFVFALGLYWWRCPDFLKKFGSYAQYERLHGAAFEPLRPMLHSILDALTARGIQNIREAVIEHGNVARKSIPSGGEDAHRWLETWIGQMVRHGKSGPLNEIFDTIVRDANRLHRGYLIGSTILFFLGLFIFLVLAVENFLVVVKVLP